MWGEPKSPPPHFYGGSVEPLERFLTPHDPAAAVAEIRRIAAEGDYVGIGVGAPGPLDAAAGEMLDPPNLEGWWNYPLAAELQRATGLPVSLENDANLGALGEAHYGGGRGYQSLFYLTISTGLGSGLIIDGKIHGGRAGMAGEVWAMKPGFFSGDPKGPTVMDLASGPGLIRQACRRIEAGRTSIMDPETLDTRVLLKAAKEGDVVAIETLEASRDAAAGLIVAVIVAVAPEVVVLGGGLCTDPSWYVDPITERVKTWVGVEALKDTPIRRAELWDDAVLYGAGALFGS
jgi:glucokinase